MPTRAAILARRRRLRHRYRDLYDQIARILHEHDPINIGYAVDEYEPEVERILPRIEAARSVAEVIDVVHEVFREMFSPQMAGPRKRYEAIAAEIWKAAKGASKASS